MPCELLHRWLTLVVAPTATATTDALADACFSKRELIFVTRSGAFTRARLGGGSVDEFRAALVRKTPLRVENVTLNSVAYEQRHLAGPSFTRVHKELAFDIDIDDYDDVRACCTGSAFCRRCWTPLVGAAVCFIERLLHGVYGHANLMWVFSGRRGMHCWVIEAGAGYATDERAAIAARVSAASQVPPIDASGAARTAVADLPPSYWRVLVDAMYAYFDAQPDLFGSARVVQYLARRLYGDGDALHAVFVGAIGSAYAQRPGDSRRAFDAWLARGFVMRNNAVDRSARELAVRCCAAALCAPRIDTPVTALAAHAVKMPFCVHPATRTVCTPMSTEQARTFYPCAESIVRIDDVLAELRASPESTVDDSAAATTPPCLGNAVRAMDDCVRRAEQGRAARSAAAERG